MIELLKAVVLGMTEGFTEWLPVSAAAHLMLMEGILRPEADAEVLTALYAALKLGASSAALLILEKNGASGPSKGGRKRRPAVSRTKKRPSPGPYSPRRRPHRPPIISPRLFTAPSPRPSRRMSRAFTPYPPIFMKNASPRRSPPVPPCPSPNGARPLPPLPLLRLKGPRKSPKARLKTGGYPA